VPKEITHWLIAEEVGRQVAQTEYPAMLRLGAIVHDVLYYAHFGNNPYCTALANSLHGSEGEDTFTIVHQLAENVSHTDSSTNALRAFLLGAVTHICADIMFHPFIYYSAGNPFSNRHYQAWKNHRALESAIDLAFCKERSVTLDSISLRSDFRYNQDEVMTIISTLAQKQRKVGWKIRTKDYHNGYTTLGRLRPLLANTTLNALLDGVERNFPSLLRKTLSAESWSYLGLRYSEQNPWNVQDVHARLHYRHPVSGEEHDTNLQELFDTAVQESVRVWQHLEQTILGGEPLLEKGKSLEVGLYDVPSAAMRYFATL
jgi:hypothetical protein